MGTGNCFYVSMPAGPPDSTTEPSQPNSLPVWQTEPEPQAQLQGGSGGCRRPSRSPPSMALRDVGSIFHTIEQLTVKLNRLKVEECGGMGGLWPLGVFSPLSLDPSPT